MTTTRPLCIWHSNCPDGFAAAWIVLQAHPVCDFWPGVYGEAPPEVDGRDVILVDFTYDADTMSGIADAARSVTILDHHQSAIANVQGVRGRPRTMIVLDMDRSGAGITWDYYRPVWGKAVTFDGCARDVYGYHPDYRPAWVNFTEDRDLWRFRYDETRDWFAVATSYPYDFAAWDAMLDRPLRELLIEGAAINRHRDARIAETVATAGYREIGGLLMPVACAPYALGSDVAGWLAERDIAQVAAYYTDSVATGTRHWGLRSTEAGPDVAAIAEKLGGGGHRHAAGFRTPMPEWPT